MVRTSKSNRKGGLDDYRPASEKEENITEEIKKKLLKLQKKTGFSNDDMFFPSRGVYCKNS